MSDIDINQLSASDRPKLSWKAAAENVITNNIASNPLEIPVTK